jgi:DNA-binding transcriptional ArsR family regulator
MGYSSLSDAHTGTAPTTGNTGEVLAALEDEDCRRLLQAAADSAMSASELAEACEMPLSTTYRKVDILTEAGLLDEQLRLRRSGKHTSEYTLCVESIQLSIGDDGIEMHVTGAAGGEEKLAVPAGAD